MRCWKNSATMAVAIAVLWCFGGCQPSTEKKAPSQPPKPVTIDASVAESSKPGPEQAAPPAPVERPEPPPKPVMPQVVLTEALATTCLVKVGDTLPAGTVSGPDGQAVEVASTLGSRLTVLYFWKGDSISALEGLRQIEKNVAGPYAEKGVGVVPINETDPPAEMAQKLKAAGVSAPSFRDPDGAYFAKLATAGLPRVYLVDQQGRILWFDTEFSLGTEHSLLQAVEYTLAQ